MRSAIQTSSIAAHPCYQRSSGRPRIRVNSAWSSVPFLMCRRRPRRKRKRSPRKRSGGPGVSSPGDRGSFLFRRGRHRRFHNCISSVWRPRTMSSAPWRQRSRRARFAGALGAAAKGLVHDDPLLALALAAEAMQRVQSGTPGYEARAAMIAARELLTRGNPVVLGSPIPAGDALAIAISPDGSLLAVGQRNGNIDVLNTAKRNRVRAELARSQQRSRRLGFLTEWSAACFCRRRWQARVVGDRKGASQPRVLEIERRTVGSAFQPRRLGSRLGWG